MINEKENLEMCKIQQKHFLHNLLSIKENDVEIDRNGNFTYSKISPTTKNDCFRVLSVDSLNIISSFCILSINSTSIMYNIIKYKRVDLVVYIYPFTDKKRHFIAF